MGVLNLYLQHTSNVNGLWEWVYIFAMNMTIDMFFVLPSQKLNICYLQRCRKQWWAITTPRSGVGVKAGADSIFDQLESESELKSTYFWQLESESESEHWPGVRVGIGAGTCRNLPRPKCSRGAVYTAHTLLRLCSFFFCSLQCRLYRYTATRRKYIWQCFPYFLK